MVDGLLQQRSDRNLQGHAALHSCTDHPLARDCTASDGSHGRRHRSHPHVHRAQPGPWLGWTAPPALGQGAYAEHALSIASMVAGMLAAYDLEDAAGADDSDTEPDDQPLDFNLWMDFDGEDGDEGFNTASAGSSRTLAESGGAYRVFTAAFDTETYAATLVRAAALQENRERLDRSIERQGLSVARLARELNAVLATPVRDGWLHGQEEGYIDGRQLSQLITSPSERRFFRMEQHAPVAESAVSFLVDCSGSMREHIESVAILIDVMTRALDQIGVTTEVLGFTTNA